MLKFSIAARPVFYMMSLALEMRFEVSPGLRTDLKVPRDAVAVVSVLVFAFGKQSTIAGAELCTSWRSVTGSGAWEALIYVETYVAADA